MLLDHFENTWYSEEIEKGFEHSDMFWCFVSWTKLCVLFFFPLGIYEALELRDEGSDSLGKGVSKVSLIY